MLTLLIHSHSAALKRLEVTIFAIETRLRLKREDSHARTVMYEDQNTVLGLICSNVEGSQILNTVLAVRGILSLLISLTFGILSHYEYGIRLISRDHQ